MMTLPWLGNTIAGRFALTVVSAVAVTWLLAGLFSVFAGQWVQPPLERSGLLQLAGSTLRMVGAAPPRLRSVLARAGSGPGLMVDWYATDSPLAAALRDQSGLSREELRHTFDSMPASTVDKLLAGARRVLISRPEEPASALISKLGQHQQQDRQAYVLATQYPDGSWLVFTAPKRLWGLSNLVRYLTWTLLLVVSTTGVSLIATGELIRPIHRFTDAIRLFGINPRALPVGGKAPRELAEVISAFNAMQMQIQTFVTDRVAMLAAISHDLRTPLTRIRLRGEFIDDPVQRSALFRDVDDLQMMVDGALSFFRGDANTEAMTSFDLSGLLQIVVDDFADQGVEIEYAGSARAAFYGRPFALKRAITNLVENAVKYATPPVIELTHGGGAFIIAIRDHGPGIPAEALEHVFQPFFRLESSRHRATGGVGLGLTAAQVVIREHGGEIALLNLPGAGLEAVVTLPRSEPEPESMAK